MPTTYICLPSVNCLEERMGGRLCRIQHFQNLYQNCGRYCFQILQSLCLKIFNSNV